MRKWLLGFVLALVFLAFLISLRVEMPQTGIAVEKGSSFFGYRNVRDYIKDNVRFESRPIEGGNNFTALVVGCPARPYTGVPQLLLRLSDGAIVNTATVDVDMLKTKSGNACDLKGTVFTDIGTPSMDLYGKWPDGALGFQIGDWRFTIFNNRLINFEILYHDYSKSEIYDTITYEDGSQVKKKRISYGVTPAIGLPGETTMYQFPLKQSEVIHIFGKPDKIIDYLIE